MRRENEPPWVGPLVWALFLNGFVLMLAAKGRDGFIVVGAVSALLGLVGIVATGRVWPH